MLAPISFLATALLALPTGTVRVVDAVAGPYPTIQSAINVAQDGDTVLIKTGTYSGFTATNKALAIVGDTGALVRIQGPVTIRDLAAGKTTLLSRLRSDPGTLHLLQDHGSVRVESCVFVGEDAPICAFDPAGDGVRIVNCLDVAMSMSTFRGGLGDGEFQLTGGFGVAATNSVLALYSCQSVGGGARTCCDGSHGGSGGSLVGTRLFVAGGAFLGANGASSHPLCQCSYGGDGGSGLLVNASSQLWHFAPAYAFGSGGSGHGGFGCGGNLGGSLGVALVLAPGAQSTNLASGPLRTLVVDPSPARAQTLVGLSVQGLPGERVLLRMSGGADEFLHPAAHGVLAIDVSGPTRQIDLGAIPASGTLTRQLPIATLASGEESRVFHLQATHASSGMRVLGNPAALVVVDPSF